MDSGTETIPPNRALRGGKGEKSEVRAHNPETQESGAAKLLPGASGTDPMYHDMIFVPERAIISLKCVQH
jgi:hypothetical protein